MTKLYLKRAYEPASESDGVRVYIDRLWPRGLSHATFLYDFWNKEIAPSTELRKWLHEDPDNRWHEFTSRYESELRNNPEWSEFAKKLQSYPIVTLIYSSHNEKENNAVVVAQTLMNNYPEKFIYNP